MLLVDLKSHAVQPKSQKCTFHGYLLLFGFRGGKIKIVTAKSVDGGNNDKHMCYFVNANNLGYM